MSHTFLSQHEEKNLWNLSAYQSNHDIEYQENVALSGLWQQYIYIIVYDTKLEAVWKDQGQGLLNELVLHSNTSHKFGKKGNYVKYL